MATAVNHLAGCTIIDSRKSQGHLRSQSIQYPKVRAKPQLSYMAPCRQQKSQRSKYFGEVSSLALLISGKIFLPAGPVLRLGRVLCNTPFSAAVIGSARVADRIAADNRPSGSAFETCDGLFFDQVVKQFRLDHVESSITVHDPDHHDKHLALNVFRTLTENRPWFKA